MAKERKFRAFTCRKCAKKHAWEIRNLPEVGRGQCYFCQEVSRELYETPLLIITPKGKKGKSDGKNVDFL
jgi:hypothetical protein